MSNQLSINVISASPTQEVPLGVAVAMVGTFAPIHTGHFDALHAAARSLELANSATIDSLILVPNSEEYVRRKLPDFSDEWTYDSRIQRILAQDTHPTIPTFVDNVSGARAQNREINPYVPGTIRRYLGHQACQVYMVVGSDQLQSMEPHLEDEANRAICVLRPNYLDDISEKLTLPWVTKAIGSNRLIVTERQDMERDVSSTAIRMANVFA